MAVAYTSPFGWTCFTLDEDDWDKLSQRNLQSLSEGGLDFTEWLVANVGAIAVNVPPKPQEVLSEWLFTSMQFENPRSDGGPIYMSDIRILGFRHAHNAALFKLTWL